jgi:hypothetical protein
VRIVVGVTAALMAASIVGIVRGAFAGDMANGEQVPRYLLFSGFDLWHAGAFAHGGVLWSPAGLGRRGFTFKLLIAGGRYQYRSGKTDIVGRQLLASAMPGWRFVRGKTEFTVFAGLDLQQHRFTPDDPRSDIRGSHAGVRVGADFWSEPVEDMMITGAVSASTIGPNIWCRAAAGVRLSDWAWIGPELQMMGDGRYEQFRAGTHVTALRAGRFEWSAGFGYALDSDDRDGVYGRIGLLTKQ